MMKTKNQLSFFNNKKINSGFGGSLLLGKRKSKRPLSAKKPIHLILKTDTQFARSLFSPLYKNSMKSLKRTAEQFKIKIHELAFNFTHVHLVISFKSSSNYIKFIRVFTCRLAFLARAKLNSTRKIFNFRPYSRIVSWGNDFRRVLAYLFNNQVQSEVLHHMEIYQNLGIETG
jgi:hypothetical protein